MWSATRWKTSISLHQRISLCHLGRQGTSSQHATKLCRVSRCQTRTLHPIVALDNDPNMPTLLTSKFKTPMTILPYCLRLFSPLVRSSSCGGRDTVVPQLLLHLPCSCSIPKSTIYVWILGPNGQDPITRHQANENEVLVLLE